MDLLRVIVHKVIKAQNEQPKVELREEILANTDPVNHMMEKLTSSYKRKTGKAFGVFDEDNPFFSRTLSEYLESDAEEQEKDGQFVEFSRKCVEKFESLIKKQNLATSGYLLFAHYEEDEQEHFLVANLHHTSGSAITETLTVEDVKHLDFKDLHTAARVDLSEWENEADNYLSFMSAATRATEVATYFREFLGCKDYIDSKTESEKLRTVVHDFIKHNDLDRESANQLRNEVLRYCEDKARQKEPVSLESMAHVVYDQDPEAFLEFLTKDDYRLSDHFHPHRKTLKSLGSFAAKSKDLDISFPRGRMGRDIEYDVNQKSLRVTITDEDLHEKLKALKDEQQS